MLTVSTLLLFLLNNILLREGNDRRQGLSKSIQSPECKLSQISSSKHRQSTFRLYPEETTVLCYPVVFCPMLWV